MLVSKHYVLLTNVIKLTAYIMTIPCFQIYWQHPYSTLLNYCFAYIPTLYLVLLCKQPISQQETPSKCKPLQLQLKLGQPHLSCLTLQEFQNCLTWSHHATFTRQSLWRGFQGTHQRTRLSHLPILSLTHIPKHLLSP